MSMELSTFQTSRRETRPEITIDQHAMVIFLKLKITQTFSVCRSLCYTQKKFEKWIVA